MIRVFKLTIATLTVLTGILSALIYFVWTYAPDTGLRILPHVVRRYTDLSGEAFWGLVLLVLCLVSLPLLLIALYRYIFVALAALARQRIRPALVAVLTVAISAVSATEVLIQTKRLGFLLYRDVRYVLNPEVSNYLIAQFNSQVEGENLPAMMEVAAEYEAFFPNGERSRVITRNLSRGEEREELAHQLWQYASEGTEGTQSSEYLLFVLAAADVAPWVQSYSEAAEAALDNVHLNRSEFLAVLEYCANDDPEAAARLTTTANLPYLDVSEDLDLLGYGVTLCNSEATRQVLLIAQSLRRES
jgi:uncharacterized tellurite resistance protein B-like protein